MKRLLILSLCASMLLSCFLTGCNNTADPAESTGEATATEKATTQETEPAGTTSEETESETEPVIDNGPMPEAGQERSLSNVAVVAGDSATEVYAAAELTKYLELADVTMKDDGYPIKISIDPEMGEESYRIKIFRKSTNGTTIVGGNRGVIYGVYRLLEEMGFRFFTPELEVIPEGRVALITGVIEYEPVFEMRQSSWIPSASDIDWCVKNGLNQGTWLDIPEEKGDEWSYYLWCHSFAEITGTPWESQPCLTDPAILETAKAYVRNVLETRPKAQIISISQNDNYNYCKCENCAAVDAEEGSPSGTLLRFVNAIAADIAEDYPDVIVDTLAYQYTQTAPKITKPLPNVCVRLCSLHCCSIHGFDDPNCRENQNFAKDLLDWEKICDRLYIWDYTNCFAYAIPTYENLFSIREKMRFYADHNVKGMFTQGNSDSVSGEFGDLRAYLLAKLMQNPYMTDREYDTHMNEFLKAYYGEGWMHIRAYIELVCRDQDSGCRAFYFDPFMVHDANWYQSMEDTFDLLWDKAEEKAGDRLAYVQRSRLQWRYIKLMYAPNEEEAKKFVEDVTAAGIYWREGVKSLPEGVSMSGPIHLWMDNPFT
ncbi:MAG: DUF4838 domain-containing protein [Ruminococcaceae bacterium]|nr:DUF4838 domain-containing protein [Oscillospiraceae bacterium]